MKMFQRMLAILTICVFSVIAAHASPIVRSEKNIVEIAAANPNFSTLVAAVKAANLVDTLTSPGPFTVFAPTNAAFAKLPAGTVEFLLANTAELTKILTYHVLASEKGPALLLRDGLSRTVQGKEVRVRLDRSLQLFINKSLVVAKPIYAANGVIYVIDAVLIP